MIYYLKEENDKKTEKNAGSKARNDIEKVFLDLKIQPLTISNSIVGRDNAGFLKKISLHYNVYNNFKKQVATVLKKGDILFVQFPILNHSVLLTHLFKRLIGKKIRIILIIHDLDMFRVNQYTSFLGKKRIELEEEKILNYASSIIAHNTCMINKLSDYGIDKDKIVDLKIFDYLSDFNPDSVNHIDNAVMIAGNLIKKKTGYVYDLPEDVEFYLYGANYEGDTKNRNIHYFGSFSPEELPMHMTGKFGLVWDGTSSKSCEGVYGEYLRINNPHKTSLYLSSGIPVIIWKEAALAKFIVENNCGIVIDSLYDLSKTLNNISEEQYKSLENGVKEISKKMKKGYYTIAAINEALNRLESVDGM